jgi:hypothetical protein
MAMIDRTRDSAAPADDRDIGAPIDLHARKERVLHTRVPESLDRHIKRRARNLGLSVSTVLRHVLLNTFGLVEDIMTDSANIALSITQEEAMPRGERAHRRGLPGTEGAPTASDVLGWQEAALNVNAVCGQCNAVLRRGVRAAIGVRERPGPRAIICTRCLGKLEARTRERGARPARRRRTPSEDAARMRNVDGTS